MSTPIPEPVPKEVQHLWVTADQDLMFLFQHGMSQMTARLLAAMRAEIERAEGS